MKRYKLLAAHYINGHHYTEDEIITEAQLGDNKVSSKMVEVDAKGRELGAAADDADDANLDPDAATYEEVQQAAEAIVALEDDTKLTKSGLAKKKAIEDHLGKTVPKAVFLQYTRP